MFCRNCGFNNADGVRFCAKCGNALEAAPAAPAAPTAPNYGAPAYGAAPAGTPAYSAVTKATSAVSSAKVRKVLPFAAAGVAAAIVVILLFSLIFGNSAKSVAKKAIDRAIHGEIVNYSKLYHKEYREENDMTDNKAKNEMKDAEKDWKDALEDFADEEGGKLRVSYKIKDEDELDDEEFDSIEEYYDDEYNLEVKKAKIFEIEVSAKWDDEEEEYDAEVIVVKIGGKWYLYSCDNPIAGLLYEYM